MLRTFFCNAEWTTWAWPGLLIILGGSWFAVQVDVKINQWNGHFFNLLGNATSDKGGVETSDLYDSMFDFAKIAGVYILVAIFQDFFISHWTFRWRTALTDNYIRHWEHLRHIEGASQRIQEDTMRFSKTVEALGEQFMSSLLTLVAFLPLLSALSEHVTALPLIGPMKNSLVWAAIAWSLFGTILLAVVGIRLPGLEFQNQLVEAAFRKELVLGEDDGDRASENVCRTLFADVRTNYFILFFNFAYFNVAKYSYLQFNVIFPFILMGPSISSGSLSMGQITQTIGAFRSVSQSFQFLVMSWKTIVELISIWKRLHAFEKGLSKLDNSDDDVSSDDSKGL